MRAHHQEEAGRVDPDGLHQLPQGDHLAPPGGHLPQFALFEQVDELPDDDLEGAGPPGEDLDGRLHARHVPVMIGAPDVDEVLEAPLQLVLVIRDVGGEVGRPPVAPDEHPVFVVTSRGGPQPDGAALPIGLALRQQPATTRSSSPPDVERGLAEPAVELHAERREFRPHLLEHQGAGPLPEEGDCLVDGRDRPATRTAPPTSSASSGSSSASSGSPAGCPPPRRSAGAMPAAEPPRISAAR